MAQNLSNLPIGAKIKFGKHSVNGETAQPITWLVVAKNHSGYPSNSVTLLTERIIDMRCFDASEPTSPNSDVKEYGLGRYELSNIRQWLNSNAPTGWFTSKHTYDQAPNGSYVTGRTEYAGRPGFLNTFTSVEHNAILSTPIIYHDYQDGFRTLNDKIFLPSFKEISGTDSGNMALEGNMWSYFGSNSSLCALTQQAYTNSMSTTKTDPNTGKWFWMTRSSVRDSGNDRIYTIHNSTSGGYQRFRPNDGTVGIRPAMNLSATLSISDSTDSDGCYTAVWNSAPPMPTTFNVPTTIYGGKTTTLSWSGVTDPDGNSVTYQLEQSINGGTFTTLYSGTNLSYNTIVPYGTTSVQFRVKATDSVGASSGYNSSVSRTVVNNVAPTISGTNSNLGNKSAEFTQTYTIGDSNSNTVTVTEEIDGVRLRSYVATLNATNTFSVTGATWLTLTNGSHTMTITATDGVDSTVRTYTFTKAVSSFTIQTTVAKESTTRPTRIKLSIGREIPVGAIFKVEVCNNGFDTTKTWEDATSSVTGGLVHIFSNTTKVNAKWGVLIKVTVNRNNTSGACYVTSIGGNFE